MQRAQHLLDLVDQRLAWAVKPREHGVVTGRNVASGHGLGPPSMRCSFAYLPDNLISAAFRA
jgi:hypothetical protein